MFILEGFISHALSVINLMKKSGFPRIKATFAAMVMMVIFSLASQSQAQWKKKYNFPTTVLSIYFIDTPIVPTIGFVMSADNNFKGLFRTSDGGITWAQITIPPDPTGHVFEPASFTFKNMSEGWGDAWGQGIYVTTDAGITWNSLPNKEAPSILFYNKKTSLLIGAASGGALYSSDGGNSFTSIPYLNNNGGDCGIAFSDDLSGITTSFSTHGPKGEYTSDGGMSWSATTIDECFQPIGIPGTKTFYAMCESSSWGNLGTISKSDDGGKTWKNIYTYPNIFHQSSTTDIASTGTLQANSKQIFFQTAYDGGEGIMTSEDSGNTFYSLCGPSTIGDSRFYVRDSFIYAADKFGGLWLNTTGIGSNSTPQLSIANKLSFQTDACKSKDSIITITFFDSCNGLQAKLVNASISSASNFSLLAPFNSPRTIHPNDSIIVHYDPSASLSDSASLHLRFHLGWEDFDTVIQLIGTASFNPTAQLSLTKLSFPGNCSYRDSLITISCFDSCSGTSATLDSISLQGSKNFSLLAPITFPKTIHQNDSLLVRYDPLSSGSDTSTLHLHFHLGAKEIDTVITLYGVRDIFPESKFSSSGFRFIPSGCASADTVLLFSFFDSCSNAQSTLVSISGQGSSAFSFGSSSPIPRTIHFNDSLIIVYDPQSPSYDTMVLFLKFNLEGKDFDTIITLSGAGRMLKENVQFIPSLSANAVSAGSSVDILIKPNKPISGKALQSISFDLNYFGDLLDYQGQNAGAGYSVMIATPKHNGKVEVLPVTITGNDLSLDPNNPIADLKFMAMVTDTTSTPITISNLKLNGADPDYQNCILSADTSATNFTEVYLCGDSTLSKYLRTGNILSITSIHPNPAQDEVEIELHSAIKQDVNFEVFDALGARVFSVAQNITGGANTIHFDTKGLSAGKYLVRVGNITQSFVKAK